MENISQNILTYIQSVPETTQLFLLFIFSFAEGLPIIGSILPGGTIAIFAGSLASQGLLSPLTSIFIIALASFLGDMVGFFIGKRFKNLKWIKKIIENEKHQKKWDLFDRHIAIISIFGKLIPVIRSTPSIFAAFRGIRTRRYIIYSLLGSILWAIAGVYAGKVFTILFGENTIVFILGLIIISILIILIRLFFKKVFKKNN